MSQAHSGPVVIDAADTDTYVAAAGISQQLPGTLCIKRKQETVLCRGLVTEQMADCIVQLHCDANSGFYGKGKSTVYSKVAKSSVAQRQLSQCGNSLDLEEDVVEELNLSSHNILNYGDKKSGTMAESHTAKWKKMKKKSFVRLPPDADSLRQHCLRANYYSISSAPPLSEVSPLATRAWLGTGGWSLSPCPPHTTCSPNTSTYTSAS